MEDNTLDLLFSGDLDKLVPLPKRVVRLFISSTFTDMMLERNSLMERVYPRLKKYCRENHGLDFQGKYNNNPLILDVKFSVRVNSGIYEKSTKSKLVVDMRWGVRDEATDDHQTSNLCSREIDNCQRMSLGPNFVALLGDKYGFRPLCNKIKSNEYRALRRCLIELDVSTDLLDTWYKEDLNAVPPEYLLQPISSILKNFTNRNEPELQSIDQRFWQAIQERLHDLLMTGSSRLVKQGRMSEQEQLMKYSISVTEREVIEGCLNVKDAKSSCLVYVRSISNVHEHLENCLSHLYGLSSTSNDCDISSSRKGSQARRASIKIGDDIISVPTRRGQNASERRYEKSRRLIGKYVDLSLREQVWTLDREAQDLLSNLKWVKLEEKLKSSPKSLTKYKIHWDEQEGMSLKSNEHKQYLNELTEHFYTNLTRMIRKAGKNEQEIKSGLIGEVLQHSHYAKHVSKSFYGRSSELERIRSYILSNHKDEGPKPMFVYGVGGSGKTSVLARSACLAKGWILRAKSARHGFMDERWEQKPCIIMRFCCTTPSSSSMVGVLTSVCRQLQFNFYQYGSLNGLTNQSVGDKNGFSSGAVVDEGEQQLVCEQIPEDLVRLVFTFHQLLDNCKHPLHRQRLFLIILDSVERLSAPASCSVEIKYSWLTSVAELPANVRLIVSCSSEKTAHSLSPSEFSNNGDYRYLKRQFLRVYFPLRRKYSNEGRNDDVDADTESNESDASADDDKQVSDATDMKKGFRSSANYQLSQQVNESFDIDLADSRLSASELGKKKKINWMKRLMIPAVRFRRLSGMTSDLVTQKVSESTIVETPEEDTNSTTHPPVSLALPSTSAELSKLSSPNEQKTLTNRPLQLDERENLLLHSERRGKRRKKQQRKERVRMLHVRPLGVDLALNVLQRWLAEVGRCLSQQQWSIVRKSLLSCSRPIFVKLAYGEIVNWKSYSMQSDSSGLTFGSAILENNSELDRLSSSPTSLLKDAPLMRLLTRCSYAKLSDDNIDDNTKGSFTNEELKMQILCMEQHWLNYLDYCRLKDRAADEWNKQQEEEEKKKGGKSAGSGKMIMKVAAPQSCNPSSSICHLSNTIEAAICQLFARIELQHGYLLTKHSLSYITASRNGICENELEDILSLDDVVLDDVFQYHLPPVRRIPPLLWTRIRNDLADYLSERDADGIVVNWHHNQFKEVARRRYMSDDRQLFYIHSTLADYFLGRWADQPKPFRCTKQQMLMAAEQVEAAAAATTTASAAIMRENQPLPRGSSSVILPQIGAASISVASKSVGLSSGLRARMRSSGSQQDQRLHWVQAKADRRVPHQPLYYSNKSSTSKSDSNPTDDNEKLVSQREEGRRYNLRKLTELPFHLMRSGRYLDLANSVLFNYKWLFSALDASGLQSLLSDFDEVNESLENSLKELRVQLEIPDQNADTVSALKDDVELLKSMMKQLRVLNDTIRLSCSAIHSDTQMLAPQLIGRLLPLVGRSKSQLNYLSQLLNQCDSDGCWDCALLPTDHCLQSPDGLLLSSLEGHSFAIMGMALTSDQRHLLAVSNRFVMWDISTGEVSRDIDPKIEGSIMCQLKMSLDGHYAISYTSDNIILTLNILTQQVSKFKLPSTNERLEGLNLIDLIGGKSFLAWTESSWFVMQLTVDKRSSGSMPQRVSIELVYSSHIFDLNLNHLERIISVQQVNENNRQLTLLEVKVQSSASNLLDPATGRLELLVVERKELDSGCYIFEIWGQQLEVLAASYDHHFRQLVYADLEGNLILTRRRKNRWSKSKLILKLDAKHMKDEVLENENSMEDEFVLDSVSEGGEGKVLAIELDPFRSKISDLLDRSTSDDLDFGELAQFERQIDGIEEGDQEVDEDFVYEFPSEKKLDPNSNTLENCVKNKNRFYHGTRLVKVYLANKIIVIFLDRKVNRERTFVLPRNLRNISVQANQCQIKAVVLESTSSSDDNNLRGASDSYLVAVSGRSLLLYSLESEQFLRSINAHTARIVQLLPVFWSTSLQQQQQQQHENSEGNSSIRVGIASASLDKTVKIWNLSNLDKDIDTLEKLDGAISSISLSSEQPLAACLGRAELGLWNWRKLELQARLGQAQLAPDCSRLLSCRLSSNGTYLCVATLDCLHVFGIENGMNADSISSQPFSFTPRFKFKLAPGGQVARLCFFHADLKLLVIVECTQAAEKSTNNSELEDSRSLMTTQLSRKLLLLCFAIPTHPCGAKIQPLYRIECTTPTLPAAGDSHYLGGQQQQQQSDGRKMSNAAGSTRSGRLPVLTKDEVYLVSAESGPELEGQMGVSLSSRRKTSSLARLSTVLCIYSASDGKKLRTLDLSRLELSPSGSSFTSIGRSSRSSNNSNRLSGDIGGSRNIVAVDEQFTRIKSVRVGDRQSVVALLDDERAGPSCLIDVETNQLLTRSNLWNGKITQDGRFGLSRMFKVASLRATRSAVSGPASSVSSSQQFAAGGLQLLEMRRCLPIKWLLTCEQLAHLFPAELRTTGNDSDITCGFTGTDNGYVYYYDARLRRLLLIELAESRLLANYKPALPLTRIKSSPSGEALVLGLADGSLTALAVVDPRRAESLTRLADYPSRIRRV